MKNSRLILFAMLWSLASTAEAAEHRFVQVYSGPYSVGFWDESDVSKSGNELQTSMLTVQSLSGAAGTWIDRISINCKWHSFKILASMSLNADGSTHGRFLPPSAFEPGFPPNGSGERKVVGELCDHLAVASSKSFATALEAATSAYDALDGTPQPLAVPPPPSPAFGGFPKDFFDLRVVATEPGSGNLALIDWAHVVRNGPMAHVVTLSVIGQKDLGVPGERQPSANLEIKVFDCDNLNFEHGKSQLFFKDGSAVDAADALHVPIRMNDGSIDMLERSAVCSGTPTGQSFHDLQAVMAYADTLR